MDAPTIFLATAAEVWERDEDAPLLVPALEQAGVSARPAVWDDPAEDWSAADLVVVRSTWDYAKRREEFLDWARRVAVVTSLANPVRTLEWNTDKRYLADLAGAGVPVIPTTYLSPGCAATDVATALALDGDLVVKPAVSAGAVDTERHPAAERDAARRQVEGLLSAGRDVMVQPYFDAIEQHHETGLVFVDGRFVHAFAKAPLLAEGSAHVSGLWAPEEISPRHPAPEELDVAEHTLRVASALTGSVPLYARVDLIRDADGGPVVIELELTEPSLFLAVHPGAATRVAAGFAAHAVSVAGSR